MCKIAEVEERKRFVRAYLASSGKNKIPLPFPLFLFFLLSLPPSEFIHYIYVKKHIFSFSLKLSPFLSFLILSVFMFSKQQSI